MSKLFAQDTCKYDKAGLAVQLSTKGIIAEYQYLVKEKLRITPYVAIGMEMGSTDITGIWLGYTFGANIEYGRKHRIQLGLYYGTHGVGYDSRWVNPSDSTQMEFVNRHVLTGPAFIAGYKRTASFGLFWQIYSGISYMHNPIGDDRKYFFGPAFGFGIGYKF